jgi:membrane associated rhomboid family serine protease
MFFFPFNTDAPIYYRPLGTAGLILLNILVFVFTIGSPERMSALALPHGHGLTPLAWITSNFLHGDVFHLLGNMIFLWSFGLVVEGKLGWRQFLSLYLVLGGAECALEQLIYWRAEGASLGASAAIFGLMAMSLVWAPRNDLSVFYMFGMRVGVIDVPIVAFALLKLLESLLFAALAQGRSGEMLHLLGAAVGTAAGFYMLLTQRVDCEGWDLISVMPGTVPTGEGGLSWANDADRLRRLKRKKKAKRQKKSAPVQTLPPQRETGSPARFSELVQAHKVQSAHAELQKIRHFQPEFTPTPPECLALARGLRRLQTWDGAVEMYGAVLKAKPEFSLGRLELAEILVMIQERPSAARRVLERCDVNDFSPQQMDKFEKLHERIQQLLDDGVMEIEGPSW